MGQINYSKIANYVLLGIILVLTIVMVKQCNKPEPIPPTPVPPIIQQLNDDKQDLDDNTDQTVIDYNNNTTNRSTNVKKRNKKRDQDIKRVPNLCDPVRDSIWTKLLNSKDSLPTGYWDLLEQAARK
jgi:hypothetical protein